jgi:Protein of unknown function (DUF3570)
VAMVWAGAAVVATKFTADKAGAIIAAALAIPGVIAHAETAPESATVALKYLQYQDSQPGLKRIKVTSPSIYVAVPLSPQWAIEGSVVGDSVSGATPRYHSAISGATLKMKDERAAGDVKVTRYFERATASFSASRSREHDYESTAIAADASFSSEDNNRTFNIGLGYTSDKITSSNDIDLNEKKRTTEIMVGVTQALTPNDLVQLNLTRNSGRGFYSDPYKFPDERPRTRDQNIVLLRWNHHFNDLGATLRTNYRYYRDTFGIKAHTVGAEWVQPVSPTFTVTPSLRRYSQSAASFYFDPVYDKIVGEPFPPGYFENTPKFISGDQRLSAFGGVTLGVKLAWQLTPEWLFDLKLERYEQRSSWVFSGSGSPGIAPFRANFVQLGASKKF